jgi:redox-sensitive bicupin YhaK (pirin superfamily)
MRNGSVIVPGDVQYMSAGTGVSHSEFNASETDPLHFVQIWIVPNQRGLAPRYGQERFDAASKRGVLRLVASGSGADGSIEIRQDVNLYASILDTGRSVPLSLPAERHLWLQVLRGTVGMDGHRLSAGDGLSASGETDFRFTGGDQGAEFLVFDLA